jgi:hypothetical protein
VDRDVESRDYVDRDVESRDYVDRDVESREYGSLTITKFWASRPAEGFFDVMFYERFRYTNHGPYTRPRIT